MLTAHAPLFFFNKGSIKKLIYSSKACHAAAYTLRYLQNIYDIIQDKHIFLISNVFLYIPILFCIIKIILVNVIIYI